MQKWEYCVLECDWVDPQKPTGKNEDRRWYGYGPNFQRKDCGFFITEALNELGDEGWELVGIVTRSVEGYTREPDYVFKRPKSPISLGKSA